MTARLMDAEELRAAGYVSEVVATEEDLVPRAQQLAETIANFAPLTLQVTKKAINRVRDPLLPIEDDKEFIATCYLSEDFSEGTRPFLTRLKPVWPARGHRRWLTA